MGRHKLERDKVMKVVRDKIIKGKSFSQIGGEMGVSKQRVHQVINSEEARELVKREQLKLVGSVPKAVDNLKGLVESFDGLEGIRLKLAYDASKEVLRTAGMLPVPVNSQTTITQIFQQQNIVASPVVQRFLDEQTKKLKWEDEVVEGEEVKESVV